MPDIAVLVEQISDHAPVVVLVVLLAAAAESVIGLGVVVPGETVLVLAAIALADTGWLPAAVLAGGIGAWTADHIGFLLGRRLGPHMPATWAVRKAGVDRWYRALNLVERHSVTVLVVARTLPAVRTLVSAAAGASTVSYRRFAATTAVAGLLWSSVWTVGGALLGTALIAAGDDAVLVLLLLAAAVAVGVLVRRRALAHRRLGTSPHVHDDHTVRGVPDEGDDR